MNAPGLKVFVPLLAGFVVWSVGFVLLYALQALGCAYGWPLHRALLIGAYVVVLAPLVWLAFGWRAPASPLGQAALWANRAALVAGVLTFLPVTFASTCL